MYFLLPTTVLQVLYPINIILVRFSKLKRYGSHPRNADHRMPINGS